MYGYKVDIEHDCVDDFYDGEKYGEWRREYENSFRSIKQTTKEDHHPDVVSTHDLKKGDQVYVVWLEWSSGDSFGNAYCGYTEVCGVFKDEVCAEELRKAINTYTADPDVNDYKGKYTLECKTSDGQAFSMYTSWIGYFESLNSVHIEHTIVK